MSELADVHARKRQIPREVAFGRAIRDMRIARGLSQTQLAEGLAATGVGWFHQVTIGRIENAQRPTTLGEAYSIAEFFGVDLHEMTAAEVSTETFARADVVTAAVSIRDEADRLHRLADALIRRALAPVADPDPHTTSDKEQT